MTWGRGNFSMLHHILPLQKHTGEENKMVKEEWLYKGFRVLFLFLGETRVCRGELGLSRNSPLGDAGN